MAKEWYMWPDTEPIFMGGFEQEEFDNYALDGFEETLQSSILGEDVLLYESRMTDTPVTTRAIIQNETTDSFEFPNFRQIICRMGTNLQCGNYIRIGDDWWLIRARPGINGIYEKAALWYCNYMLKFVSPLTGEVVTYPAFTENGTRYNSGTRTTDQMMIGSSQYIVYIPYNEETILLDSGFRLILDRAHISPTAYYISQADTTSFAYSKSVGIVRFTIAETQTLDRIDDATNLVANTNPAPISGDGTGDGGFF